uniref:Peptidase A1 domain-containing protein n=1 Tax=Bursaphelenchus xylophilus TaxID=6326 RepID=A0A1I7SR99_BURXY
MHWLLLCSTLPLLFQASASAVIQFYALDGGVVQTSVQYFGSDCMWVLSQITLTSADIMLPDADCNNTYGVCPKYCNQAEFCRIYCNPICCTSEEQRIKFCSDIIERPYQHNSTEFRITGQYYRTDSAAGVWAEDVFWVNDIRKIIRVGTVPIALRVVKKGFNAQGGEALIGLGRQSKANGIVHILQRRGFIDNAIVTIAYRGSFSLYYILGEYNERYCSRDRRTVNVVGELQWMFDAKQAAFLNHKTEEHDFRIILESDSMTRMPRHLLHSFLETGIISPEYKKYVIRPNFYKINPAHLNNTFEFFFKLNEDLTLYSDLASVVLPELHFPSRKSLVLQAAALDPNPDGVEWVVGRVVLMRNCAFLDYNQNLIAFSRAIK